MLSGGTLPFRQTLRAKAWAKVSLKGANAAVVGVLLTALYTSVSTEAVSGYYDAIVALTAFLALQKWKAESWSVVILCAVLSQIRFAI